VWTEEHARWQKRDLSAKRYVYCWANGIHLEARLEEQAECILVIIGATPEGKKELVGLTDGMRESSQSWRDLLLDLKRRSLTTAPQIAVAKPALAKAGARSGSGGARRGVADNPRATLLGAQDRQHP
jgi:transposase-like protein